jgi:CRP-like cAMP-binding protein
MNGSLTIEKVILLKGVGIFSSTPSDVLLQLANTMVEVQLQAGEPLFEKGELGSSMYVIIEGAVRVHIGDHTIVELGDHEIVGELAALDPEPRSASVTAVRDTRLYRIEQETLLDLMVDQPEIIHGVIRELAKRIRLTTAREAEEDA